MTSTAEMPGLGQIEYEARFVGLDLGWVRARLAEHPDIVCDYPRVLLRRYILDDGCGEGGRGYLRLRTGELGRSYLTLKSATGTGSVDAFAEVSLEVGDEAACLELFGQLGFRVVRYQETYREQWRWGSVIFDLDEWPGLPPFVEVEAASAADVAVGARYLGLSMEAAEYDNVADTYRRYTGRDILAEPRLVF